MARTTNTFLIDLSKKIVITGGKFGNKDTSMLLYGDLEDKSLLKTSFSFDEEFDSGTEYMEKKLDDMLKPLTIQLQALMKKLPFIGDTVSNIAGSHFKDNLAFAYTFLQHTMNKDPNRDVNIANALNGLFNYIVPFNIPMRKKIPQINTSTPNSITIKFAYGKCNKYNAHDEVYAPIEALRAAMMPVIGSADPKTGLISVGNLNTLPFPQQLFIKVIDAILDKGTDAAKAGVNNIYKHIPIIGAATAKLNDSSGGLQGLIDDLTKDLPSTNPYEIKDSNMSKVANAVGNFGKKAWAAMSGGEAETNDDLDQVYKLKNLDKKWYSKTGASLKRAIDAAVDKQKDNKNDNGTPKFQTVDTAKLPGADVDDKYVKFTVPADKTLSEFVGDDYSKTFFSSSVKSLGEAMVSDALTQSGFNVEPGQIKFEGRLRADLSGLVSEGVKTPDTAEVNNLTTTLAGLASLPDQIVAKAAKDVYTSWIAGQCLTIYYGFPQRFFTSIKELDDFLTKGENYKKLARIRISGVVLAGAKFNFNLGNLDEHGYPMDGEVILSNLWSVLPPTQVLAFNGTDNITEAFRNQDNDKAL